MKKWIFSLLAYAATSSTLLMADGCSSNIFPTTCDISVVVSPIPVTDLPQFPLDPLTPAEQCLAVAAVQGYIEAIYPEPDPRLIFDRVELELPPKSHVLAFQEGDPLERIAFVGIYSPKYDKYHSIRVNLNFGNVVSYEHIHHARPSWTNSDNSNFYDLVNSNPGVIEALAKRGISVDDINSGRIQWCVAIDGRLDNLECAHSNDLDECKAKKSNGCDKCKDIQPEEKGHKRPRLFYATPWWLDGNPNTDPTVPIANYYLSPIAGINVWVDQNAESCGKVIKIVDTGDTATAYWGLTNINCPPNSYYNEYRGTLKPLQVCQPEGPSFTINGNEIVWEKWRFRFQLHPTFGLVLNLIEFNDKKSSSDPDNYKSILYQANLAEALTIYGTPDSINRIHNFLDLGEYQTRTYITPLQRGVDVPPYATMYSPVFVNETGALTQYSNALAIYEQDGGLLWRHYDSTNGIFQGRRARQLVLTHTNCVGNYDYAFYWTFNQDGHIDVSVKLTGIDEYMAVENETIPPENPFAELCHAKEVGANHQHAFNFRLDFDIDGQTNRVYEVNAVAVEPGKENPCSNAWKDELTLLKNSKEATRVIDPLSARRWLFVNPTSINSLGQQRGYSIEPKVSAKSFSGNCSRIKKRADFLNYNFIATKYSGHELYPMGKYPVERPEDHGLAKHIAEKQPLVDEDVVGWYTMIFAHDPDPVNFPILPAEEVSFSIVPETFFDQNPAMDVDPDMFQCCDSCDPESCQIDANSCPYNGNPSACSGENRVKR